MSPSTLLLESVSISLSRPKSNDRERPLLMVTAVAEVSSQFFLPGKLGRHNPMETAKGHEELEHVLDRRVENDFSARPPKSNFKIH